ncbi:MAG: ABC transporter ATP-binding protein [Syntrophobacteraceae bacterium]|jgi:putative ABC transport system ATP-binding protein|nr:ABC transporter ATP-binding protein [Syntrophobacteraceae bacterium]
MSILEAKHLTKTYTIGDRDIDVLHDVSLSVREGEFLVVQGNSGSGKTTLLSLLSGLDKPTGGRVLIEGRDITDLGEDELAPLRNEIIGFVFQSFHLVPSLTVLENVSFPAELKRDPLAVEKARALIERVGMGDRMRSFPHQLSGGERQRAAICRALVNRPRIIFADEPTGNLDSTNGKAILELLLDLRREHGTTLILVTHSPQIARMADRSIHLRDGRVNGEGIHAP